MERVVTVGDLASLEMQGGQVSMEEYDLRGITNGPNAQAAAAKRLAAVSYPLATFSILANRSAWAFRPGTPFKFSSAKLGVSELIARVRTIGGGSLSSGKIRITAQQDVFAVTWLGSTAPPANEWEQPPTAVPPLNAQRAITAPYESVKDQGGGAQRALLMASRGAIGTTRGLDAYLMKPDLATWYDPIRLHALTPEGVLQAQINELSDEIVVGDGIDLDRLKSVSGPEFANGESLLLIVGDDGLQEFIAFENVAGTTDLTLSGLARGCLDTAPTLFTAGTRVWFISHGFSLVSLLEPESPAVTRDNTIRCRPYNRDGSLDCEECEDSVVQATTPPRASRVYCPTAMLINGESYPPHIHGELVVAWLHRDRLGDWSYANSGATAAPEPGTEYEIEVWGDVMYYMVPDTLIHTESGITGTTWTYPEALEITESGLGRLCTCLKVVLRTYGQSGAHEAVREITWTVPRAA